MTKTKYKALQRFKGHAPGEEFEADLDPELERRAKARGQIQTVQATKKEEGKKDG
jgi:hypothetical protein